MNVFEFIKKELQGWGKFESIIFPTEIIFIAAISIYMKDNTFALISAICGICATILAGKGKISCYFFGMIANICYSYISFKNALWGNLGLNMLYYFPMQFVGIYKWKNHLKKETQEIYKTRLNPKERIVYSIIALTATIVGYLLLQKFNDLNPLFDSATTVLSIIAFILTIKRSIEQWYVWTIVNGLCIAIWIDAYLKGSNCFATILMWSTYFVLGLYFLSRWQRELKENSHC
ncbi:nicotinamide mononucleotide transporter [bacterium]|nr:nicotinamide mononucleotide transporter [bacterium]